MARDGFEIAWTNRGAPITANERATLNYSDPGYRDPG